MIMMRTDYGIRAPQPARLATTYPLEQGHAMTAHQSIGPATQILDDNGYDWAWAFVVFRDIPGYRGYKAGSDGSIWSNRARGHINANTRWHRLTPFVQPTGYLVVGLRDGKGGQLTRFVHALVLEAFVGPRPPDKMCCHDPDPDPSNNRLHNLRWDTHLANRRDMVRAGRSLRGSRNPRAVLTEADIPVIRDMAARGISRKEIAVAIGVKRYVIDFVLQGKCWKHVEEVARP